MYSQEAVSVWGTGLSGGAPDSVRCARLASSELPALGSRQRRTAINHRTVRWCTGQCPVRQVASSEVAALGNLPTAYG